MKTHATRYSFIPSPLKVAALLALGLCSTAHAFELRWRMGGQTQSLIRWNPQTASAPVAETTLHERNPSGGHTSTWKGARLGALIEAGIEALHPEQRAHIDWLVLHARDGREVLLPRWVATKYPLILATHSDGKPVALTSVLPWTSRAQIAQEELPLEAFFLADVERIDLMHAPERLGEVFLRRRTDPIALRGEKLFTKNCLACHAGAPDLNSGARTIARTSDLSLKNYFATQDARHGAPRNGPPISEDARRALARYADAFRDENAGRDPLSLVRTPASLAVFEAEQIRAGFTGPRTQDPTRRGGVSLKSTVFVR